MREQYSFLGYLLDGDARELTLDGKAIELEPKAFELLLLLAARPTHAFTKDELAEALWPGRIVGDSSIAQCVRKARQAVGDNAGDQRVIKTIHGVGYRFAAELLQPIEVEPGAVGRARSRVGALPWVLGLGALIIAALWLQQDPDAPAGKPIVIAAVSATEQGSLPAGIATGVRALLSQAVAEHSNIRIISDSRSQHMLAGLGLNPSDKEETLLAALHDALGAEYLMRTRIDQADTGYSIQVRLLGLDGKVEEISLPALDIVSMVRGFSRDLARGLGVNWRESEGVAVLSEDAFINEAHARALNALLSGENPTAALLFESVLSMDPELLFARYELGNARWQLGEHDVANQHYSAVLEKALERQSPRLAGHSATMLGVLNWQSGDFATAEQFYWQALEQYEAIGDQHGAASTLGNLGNLADSRGDLLVAADLHNMARERFRSAGDEVGESATYTNLAVISRLRSRMHEARQQQLQAVEMQRRLGVGSMLVRSLTYLAAIECELGQCAEATVRLDEAAELARTQGNRLGLAEIELERARFALGDLQADLARHHAETARSEFGALGMPAGELAAMLVQAESALLLRDLPTAEALLEAAEELDQGISKPRERAHRQRLFARAALLAGRPEAAREALASQIDDRDRVVAALAMSEWAETLWKERQADEAMAMWRQALEELEAFDDPRSRARLRTRLARAHLDRNESLEADLLIGNTLEWNRDDPAALLQRARLHVAQGDVIAADTVLRALQTGYEEAPADPDYDVLLEAIDAQRQVLTDN